MQDSHPAQGSGGAGDWQSCQAAQVGLTDNQKHNSFPTVEMLRKLRLATQMDARWFRQKKSTGVSCWAGRGKNINGPVSF